MIHQFVGHVSTKLDSDPILAKDALEPHVVGRWQGRFAKGLVSCVLSGSRGGRESLQRVANRMHLHVPLVQADIKDWCDTCLSNSFSLCNI